MIQSHSLVVHRTLNPSGRGFESHLNHFALLAQRLEHLFSNQEMRVRFLHGARSGNQRCLRQVDVTGILTTMVYGQVARQSTVNRQSAGSIPATPAASVRDAVGFPKPDIRVRLPVGLRPISSMGERLSYKQITAVRFRHWVPVRALSARSTVVKTDNHTERAKPRLPSRGFWRSPSIRRQMSDAWGIEDNTGQAGNNENTGPKALRDAYDAMKTQNKELADGLAAVTKQLRDNTVSGTLGELGIPATAAEQYQGEADPVKVREWATTMQSLFGGSGGGTPVPTPTIDPATPPALADGQAEQFQRLNEAGQFGVPAGTLEAAGAGINDAKDLNGLLAAWSNIK